MYGFADVSIKENHIDNFNITKIVTSQVPVLRQKKKFFTQNILHLLPRIGLKVLNRHNDAQTETKVIQQRQVAQQRKNKNTNNE